MVWLYAVQSVGQQPVSAKLVLKILPAGNVRQSLEHGLSTDLLWSLKIMDQTEKMILGDFRSASKNTDASRSK